MENASKALEIAAGVLLAVLIMTLVAYFFTSISEWPQQEDDEKEAEQTAKFNLEYEIYDKKGMYGADVISCLTKAESNNEKYYEGGAFLAGQRYGEKYWVNVYVNLNTDLEEQILVYHLQKGGTATEIYNQSLKFGEVKNEKTNQYYKLGDIGFQFGESPNGKKYTCFDENQNLQASIKKLSSTSTDLPADVDSSDFIDITNQITIDGKPYNAWLYIKNGDSVDTHTVTPLQILLDTCSTNIKQIVMNQDKSKESLEAWSTAEWRTALYDFKSRKFRCDNIKYSEITGRVNEIYFSEL